MADRFGPRAGSPPGLPPRPSIYRQRRDARGPPQEARERGCRLHRRVTSPPAPAMRTARADAVRRRVLRFAAGQNRLQIRTGSPSRCQEPASAHFARNPAGNARPKGSPSTAFDLQRWAFRPTSYAAGVEARAGRASTDCCATPAQPSSAPAQRLRRHPGPTRRNPRRVFVRTDAGLWSAGLRPYSQDRAPRRSCGGPFRSSNRPRPHALDRPCRNQAPWLKAPATRQGARWLACCPRSTGVSLIRRDVANRSQRWFPRYAAALTTPLEGIA